MDATMTQYRNLTPQETDKLRTGDQVWIMAAGSDQPFRGEVRSWHRNEEVRVLARSGHIFSFDVDADDAWTERVGERKSPEAREDEQSYYLVTAIQDDNLSDLLAASIPYADIQKRVRQLETALHDAHNQLAGRPTLEQYGALEERVRALESLLRPTIGGGPF